MAQLLHGSATTTARLRAVFRASAGTARTPELSAPGVEAAVAFDRAHPDVLPNASACGTAEREIAFAAALVGVPTIVADSRGRSAC